LNKIQSVYNWGASALFKYLKRNYLWERLYLL
jgi:hypothetical protein